MEHHVAARDLHVDWQAVLEAMLPVNGEAEEAHVEFGTSGEFGVLGGLSGNLQFLFSGQGS